MLPVILLAKKMALMIDYGKTQLLLRAA